MKRALLMALVAAVLVPVNAVADEEVKLSDRLSLLGVGFHYGIESGSKESTGPEAAGNDTWTQTSGMVDFRMQLFPESEQTRLGGLAGIEMQLGLGWTGEAESDRGFVTQEGGFLFLLRTGFPIVFFDRGPVALAAGLNLALRAEGKRQLQASNGVDFGGLLRAYVDVGPFPVRLELSSELTPLVFDSNRDHPYRTELGAWIAPLSWIDVGASLRWLSLTEGGGQIPGALPGTTQAAPTTDTSATQFTLSAALRFGT